MPGGAFGQAAGLNGIPKFVTRCAQSHTAQCASRIGALLRLHLTRVLS